MKFGIQSIAAFSMTVLFATTLAIPSAPDVLSRDVMLVPTPNTPPRTKPFDSSGLAYMDWANKMVAEGKGYWPTNRTSPPIIIARDITLTLENIMCQILVGDGNSKVEAEAKYCNWILARASTALWLAEEITEGEVCDENINCELYIHMAFGVAGQFMLPYINDFCETSFYIIENTCGGPGNAGWAQMADEDSSSADITLVGEIWSIWDDANQNTCPADTDGAICTQGFA